MEVPVPEQARGERVDRFLSSTLGQSRAAVQRALKLGLVQATHGAVEASDKVVPGQVFLVRLAPPLPSKAEPDASVAVAVVFEDEHLVVVDKPAGLVVHPGKGNWTKTLVNGLLARPGFQGAPIDERNPEGPLRPGIVHRIDKDTSGLLVVAKSEAARLGLMSQLAQHTMLRSYLAVTLGVPRAGTITTLYGRHPHQRVKWSSLVPSGKRAVTDVDVLEVFPVGAARVRCRLATGRTHQIRVHLSERAGTPLLGDSLYGKSGEGALGELAKGLGRQALHAAELGFDHPVTGERLVFASPLPAELELLLERLRAASLPSA